MKILIHKIQTRWTEQTRGQPGASKRNAVPDQVLLGQLDDVEGVRYIETSFSEASDFADPLTRGFGIISDNQQRQYGFRFEEVETGVTVYRWQGKALKELVTLKPTTWFRLIENHRSSSFESHWSYSKSVYNIYCGTMHNAKEIMRSAAPQCIIDRQTHLW